MFSWPSKAGLFDYAYDRDSAMFSRDDFEHVLSSIVSAPSASRVRHRRANLQRRRPIPARQEAVRHLSNSRD